MGTALRYLRNRSLSQGVARGQRVWIVVGVAVWGLRAIQWAWPKEESVVYRTVLQPGETLQIVHDARSSGEIRRQVKRQR